MHNVPFNTEPLDFGLNDNQDTDDDTPQKQLCPMPIQKETPSGLIDTVCKGDIEENSAGLCRYVLIFSPEMFSQIAFH